VLIVSSWINIRRIIKIISCVGFDSCRNKKRSESTWLMGEEGNKLAEKQPQNGVPKTGFGGRQVGAFSIFRSGDTGIPFIFWPFSSFFRKSAQFRG